jgi:hypothetical protein
MKSSISDIGDTKSNVDAHLCMLLEKGGSPSEHIFSPLESMTTEEEHMYNISHQIDKLTQQRQPTNPY